MSRLDVVVFGASGFTGQHTVEQLATIAAQRGLSWGIAGRSREKLQTTLKDVSTKSGKDLSSTRLLVADVQNEQSIRDMCQQAKVLVNCCGPYALYGEVVVRSAIHCKTHYVDVSGEPNFIELMQLKYDQAARDAGVYVVSACAFESIPADLGVVFLQQNFGGILNSVECYFNPETQSQSINFGTWHSMVNSLANFKEITEMKRKMYPTPLPKFTPKLKGRFPLHKRLSGWCMPFPTGDPDVVYRTQRHFYEKDGTRPVQFKSYVKFTSFFNALGIGIAFVFIYIMSQFKYTRKMLLDKPNTFSLGLITESPSEDVIKTMGFDFYLFGKGWDQSDVGKMNKVPPKKTVVAKVSGVNPAYGMTVVGVLYSAITILEEPHNMPPGGGVMTPGIAFAKTSLVRNLHENHVTFTITHNSLHQN